MPTICILRVVLAVVLGLEGLLLALHQLHALASHPGAHSVLFFVIGTAEAVACVLMLLPRMARAGAWFLVGVLVVAAVVHLLHGQLFGVSNLAVDIAAAAVVATHKAGW
jgi:uncharacterized membrane protein YphA (DoxX/SURF4 family)